MYVKINYFRTRNSGILSYQGIMIFYLLLAGCCLAYASEEWINKEESFVFDQNTLFHLNKENQGYLFDNVTKVIFYKHGSIVYSSYNNLPVKFSSSNTFYQVFTLISTAANIVMFAYCFILYQNLRSMRVSSVLQTL
ncbi:hypothetical protein PRIPAC_86172 [Pristionchus pacificus]|uniref:Uncharacterized protein n=1 Tax=Pristionchus pacificus TaxID=54126 RepID=A0A2A6BDG1_PRIPA|nr:hypothetical protein PRIPAC_86172 [Pristionchus pacificus]|eukprot:PDM63909.1 hypothetical protein PRIPAC_53692 [Pristionchus pacificus]